jgi:type II secretory pathway component GspD/PulD (secretin)
MMLSIALLIPAVVAQPVTVDREFHFAHTQSAAELQEVAAVVRNLTDLSSLAVDESRKVLRASGTPAGIAAAGWMAGELDRPAADAAPASAEYQVDGAADDRLRVFFVRNLPQPQSLQELATIIRSIGEIRRVFTHRGRSAIAVRGSASQINLAAFLLRELDQPAGARADSAEHPLTPDTIVRVFYLSRAQPVAELQEIATLVRHIGEIRHMFTYSASRGIAIRGNPEQTRLARWLIRELDQPAEGGEHKLSGPDDRVRVFYVTNASTPQQLQEFAVKVRREAAVRTLFTYSAPKALALRGTAAQLAVAARMIEERGR